MGSARNVWRGVGLAALLAAPLPLGAAAAGVEWPGLWGPGRDARLAGPLKVEPGAQIREVWRRPIGKGFSEVAVDGGRGYALFTDGEVDQLQAFDMKTGQEVWRRPMEATYRGHDGSDDGPISTPVLSGGRIFVLNPFGKLFAFEQESGKPLWQLDLQKELGGVKPWWGFATAPLPAGKALVVQAAGAEKNNVVGLDPATGKVLWSAHPAKGNGYSSPVLMTLGGVRQAVAATADQLFGLDPETGVVLWSHPSIGEPRQSPVALPGDRLFVTQWNESAVLEVKKEAEGWKVREVWKKPVLKTTYSPTVFHGGYLYGMNGTFLTCLDPETGEPKWREKVYNASLILVDGHLAVLGERSGNFHLVEATPDGFREKLRARVFNPGARSMTGPEFVGGRFLVRNVEEMVLFELTAPAAAGKAGS
ncbi:MAG TPA: PQQ-binding-like beta-propeller repeat protein [Thermoanaerobaculia bacterium]|nr:PQQ-binding-like beta-propeller repeat protein [Thermoanaerobaculia bacterium]